MYILRVHLALETCQEKAEKEVSLADQPPEDQNADFNTLVSVAGNINKWLSSSRHSAVANTTPAAVIMKYIRSVNQSINQFIKSKRAKQPLSSQYNAWYTIKYSMTLDIYSKTTS